MIMTGMKQGCTLERKSNLLARADQQYIRKKELHTLAIYRRHTRQLGNVKSFIRKNIK